MKEKRSFFTFSKESLKTYLVEHSFSKFVANQVFDSFYTRPSAMAMKDLSERTNFLICMI